MTTMEVSHPSDPSNLPKVWGVFLIGFLVMYAPTYWWLIENLWGTYENGHGMLVFMISVFLFWQKRDLLFSTGHPFKPAPAWQGFTVLGMGLVLYFLGQIQEILFFEVGSQILVLLSFFVLTIGWKGAKNFWFPLFFLLFMVPLPSAVVDALTLPMKIAVSTFSEWIMYHLDYPVARKGVILQVAQYKLLVADACAGLHTVFTLEAMGLLYLHLIKRDSFARNVSLAILIMPISFLANTIRVVTLVLVTYYFGDEVGQGFVHDFAGFVLFGVALVLIIFTDTLIHYFERRYQRRKNRVA